MAVHQDELLVCACLMSCHERRHPHNIHIYGPAKYTKSFKYFLCILVSDFTDNFKKKIVTDGHYNELHLLPYSDQLLDPPVQPSVLSDAKLLLMKW